MPKTKISEFSATPGNNTDIDGINISEGCAPSGINDAIRELMAQLKDFQAGTAGDSFNGPVGTTTPAAGAFTNLSASGTFALTGDQVQISEGGTGQTTANAAFNALAPSQTSNAGKYLKTDGTNTSWDAIDINTADITGTLPIANGGTGLTALGTGVQTALGQNVTGSGGIVLASSPSLTTPNLGTPSAVTLTNATGLPLSTGVTGTLATTNGGTGLTSFTANGVVYASSSSALTTGSALNFDGTNLGIGTPTPLSVGGYTFTDMLGSTGAQYRVRTSTADLRVGADASSTFVSSTNTSLWFGANNAEGMRLTSTGLGIGTSSPARKFEVHGTPLSIGGTATGMLVSIVNNNTAFNASPTSGISLWNRFNSGGSTFPSAALQAGKENATDGNYAGYLSFYTVDSVGGVNERMRLDSSGNLGLGVTPSAWGATYRALDVRTGAVYDTPAGTASGFTFNAIFNGTNWVYKGTGGNATAVRYEQGFGQHLWYTAPSGTAGNAISFTQAMTLDASGNLGVGTTSPSQRLDVRGSVYVQRDSNPTNALAVQLTNQTTVSNNGCRLSFDAFNIGSSALGVPSDSASLAFYTGGVTSERARITSGGDFCVGTTAKVYEGVISVSFNGGGGAGDQGIALIDTNATLNGDYAIFINSSGNVAGKITHNGTTTVAYTTSSDYRLKENIQPMTDALAKVAALKPVTYKWKADGSDGEGFIAHELQEVCPSAVIGEKDAVDEYGKPKHQGIDTSFLVATLTAAIQEQQAIITDLRARVAQLEAK